MQQQYGRTVRRFVPGFQEMDIESIDAAQNARPHAGGQDGSGQGLHGLSITHEKAGRARLPGRPMVHAVGV
jgi:hypothetical protein